ncbi:molybdopterin molybdotransferase MoeA [Maliponia aquimaris]|uniref:Molybdopterin molybdenumtransferase n=1 Tax=Maliponia aquimaris TaxID=1673631 RepID=A0A238L7H5_9RHOB|nr:gephyrin-like molybdotransferase Glp [Maliponia aquimaris]SMX50790.1 Molybdopterin molybdenumtransferase [Maliponia aquimaris]
MTYVQTITGLACGCDAADPSAGIVSIDEALDRIAAHVAPVSGTVRVGLAEARGRVLAEPVLALSDMPRFDHAAMDGYALRRSDLAGPGPWRLPVALRCAAGEAAVSPLPPGSAARIFTGAPLPAGADCVVMQEEIDGGPRQIVLHRRPAAHENIRFRAEERRQGGEIVAAGLPVSPRAIAAAAASGHAHLVVRRRLRVALLVSGSEVAAPGRQGLGAADIWDVNTPMLRAMLARPDIDLVAVETVPDSPGGIRAALERASRGADLVITTGGVSVGEEDHLRGAVRALDGREVFAGVAIKPGKPVAFGRLDRALWLGLPGNPQSAFVTWTLFGEAILGHLSGLAAPVGTRRHVVLAHPLHRKPGRCEIRAAALVGIDGHGRETADCGEAVHSGQVGALCASDGLVFLPADADHLPQGALVEFLPLRMT